MATPGGRNVLRRRRAKGRKEGSRSRSGPHSEDQAECRVPGHLPPGSDVVQRCGRAVPGAFNPAPVSRIGVCVSKKLGKATVRNRVRRPDPRVVPPPLARSQGRVEDGLVLARRAGLSRSHSLRMWTGAWMSSFAGLDSIAIRPSPRPGRGRCGGAAARGPRGRSSLGGSEGHPCATFSWV